MTRRLIGPCVVLAMTVLVLGATAEAVDRPALVAVGASGGRTLDARTQEAPPLPLPYLGYSLTYDGFGGTCSATGFAVTTTGHQMFPTAVQIIGNTSPKPPEPRSPVRSCGRLIWRQFRTTTASISIC